MNTPFPRLNLSSLGKSVLAITVAIGAILGTAAYLQGQPSKENVQKNTDRIGRLEIEKADAAARLRTVEATTKSNAERSEWIIRYMVETGDRGAVQRVGPPPIEKRP